MFFCDKLSALLSLTMTKNSELARAIHIDQSQISRMKTGAREQPRKSQLFRLMADYFAKRCDNEYRLSALAELTGNFRIQPDITEHRLSDILFDWLSAKDEVKPKTRAEHFLYSISQYTVGNSGDCTLGVESWHPQAGDFAVYYGNEGKRQATVDFARLIFSSQKTYHILIASDECRDWVCEDAKFDAEISRIICSFVQSGNTFTHIVAPTANIDDALTAIQRWLPAYVAGATREYYYPWLRDKLFRRTLFVVPGLGALYSESIGDTAQSRMTTLTTVPEVVDAYEHKFEDYLALCKPTMETYTEETVDKLYPFVSSATDDYAGRLYKFASLSTYMLPAEIMEHICKQEGTKMAELSYRLHLQSIEIREKALERHGIEDIICLAPPDAVRNGKVPIPNALLFKKPYFYTVDEYKAHLQSIIDKLESTEMYNVIITDRAAENSLIMFVKGNERAFIVKTEQPFTMVNIIEPRLTAAFCDYMRLFADSERHKCSRLGTIKQLKKYIARL